MTRVLSFAVIGLLVGTAGLDARLPQATPSKPIKVGLLPFMDATASGNRDVGPAVSRTVQAEMVHSTNLLPRVITLERPSDVDSLDGEKAVELGKKNGVDVVVLGTVLEAKAEESNKGGWIPRVAGQSGSINIRSIKARVTLQAEVYSVATGAKLNSLRITGNHSDNKFGGTAWTSLGSWSSGNYGVFLESPLGKALQQAIADMVKKIAATRLTSS